MRGLTRADLQGFHSSFVQPANATIVAVGDVTAPVLQARLDEAFGSWSGAGSRLAPVAAAAQARARSVWLIDIPGAPQSEIRIGRVGPPRSTPDYFPLIVANTVLGGSFTSRLNQNLREQHGYTYGASSRFDFRLSTGPFVAGAAVETSKTAPALAEFFKELEGIRKPIGEEELARARNYVALRYPAGFETTGELAGKLEGKVLYNLPDDYFNTYMDRVAKVTPSDVARVAGQYIDPRSVVVIVVGDRKKIESEIRTLNLGPLKVLSVDEILGRPPGPKSKGQTPK